MSWYLDTSVVMALLTADAHSHRVRQAFDDTIPRLWLSDLARAEFVAVVGRRLRTGLLSRDEANAALDSLDRWASTFSDRVPLRHADAPRAEALLRRFELRLRTQDAMHLAVVERLAATIVTFDDAMARAAGVLGLSVLPA